VKNLNLFISAGFGNQDKYAAEVVRLLEVVHDFNLKAWGIGGKHMAEAKVELVLESEQMSLENSKNPVSSLLKLLSLEKTILAKLLELKPDVAFLVGNSSVNLKIAKLVKKYLPFCKVVYFIAPQVWALQEQRINDIPNLVDRLLTVLPFEEPLHKEFGTSARFVGHPKLASLWTESDKNKNKKNFLASQKIKSGCKLVVACPGSTEREAALLLPVYIESAKELIKRHRKIEFILLKSDDVSIEDLQKILKRRAAPKGLFRILEAEKSLEAFQAADLAWARAGTITLEAAYCGLPHIVTLKEDSIFWRLMMSKRRIKFFGLSNIVAGGLICPELIQQNCNSAKLIASSEELLGSQEIQKQIKACLNEKIREFYETEADALETVAQEILTIHQINRARQENQFHIREQAKRNSAITATQIKQESSRKEKA
jgi:lipid-A-disaccharide synthase